ncbi:hypothetical protein [Oerskovia enterophila]|uniref:Uncharacterized protein n=1 Tax=Oerskovia enterophila TaxID=43678 RepID=A0A163QWT7_9CELL|nr:hypothetical protein [Oerskovia enterophila]KZM34621.1 hypothetical protein OJAG_26560 [Oerskovia enterophila]OCI30954.1 hypothetical protein OERS_22990 [Oerskovia enterophila]
MSTNWNLGFTQMLRNTQPSYWGNWSLDAHVAAGAVGIVTPTTGAFQYVSTLPSADIATTTSPSNEWKVQSSDVSTTSAAVNLNGSVVDPDTGTKVDAGLELTWKFGHEGSLSSTFLLANQSYLASPLSQIGTHHDWLVAQAKSAGMYQNGQITQGFGIITQALMAVSGLNLGAQSSNSSFSITGSVGATNAMAGNAGGDAKGSYAQTKSSSSFEQHLWPADPNVVATTLMPVAYQFASFVGQTPVLGWTNNLSGISILLDDSHSGTYIVDATATYTVDGVQHSSSASVSGGRATAMNPIPVNATGLQLDLAFKGMFDDEKHRFNWPSPVGQFPNGQIIIDLYGVWPGATRAVERGTGAVG